MNKIDSTIHQLSIPGKGIMALDESPRSMGKRFELLSIPNDADHRFQFFSMIFGTKDLSRTIAGVILYDDLLRDSDRAVDIRRRARDQGLCLGVRADKGIIPLPGHPGQGYTIGLDDLNDRLDLASSRQCGFVKWRAAFRASPGDQVAFRANAIALALFASAAHERRIVPIVEAEIEMDGSHYAAACAETQQAALACIFETLADFRIDISGLVLKTNFVVPGSTSGEQISTEDVGDATNAVLRSVVPDNLPLIAFLSGGQSSETSIKLLADLSHREKPWRTTFSFGRALWMEPLEIWSGNRTNIHSAQHKLQDIAANAGAAV